MMNAESLTLRQELTAHRPSAQALGRVARAIEDLLLVVLLILLVVIPLTDAALLAGAASLPDASAFGQHLTLILCMAGAAVAARENRLLAIGIPSLIFSTRLQPFARGLAYSAAAVISTWLAFAGYELAATERSAGTVLAFDVPVWALECAIPAGFAAIALRLVYHGAARWRMRLVLLAIVAIAAALPASDVLPREQMLPIALAMVALAAVCGAPVFALIGGCAIALLWSSGFPIAAMAVKHYSLATTPAIPTIPLFTLAGYFLAEGGAARRLVRVCQGLVGHWRGGPAIVTAVACAFFTCFTGASGVTILALGGLLLPVLLATRYEERAALGLVTGAGSLGLLFPPCLPLILYAVVASQALESFGSGAVAQYDVSIERMFVAGIGPGVLLVALTALWGWHKAPRRAASTRRFDGREAAAALWDAKWELAMPIVALGALFGGWLTSPVQAAALTALYAFVIETLVYRDFRVGRDLVRVLRETGLLAGSVLVILGVALGLTNYLVTEQIPDLLIEWVTATTDSRLVFLLALNVLLIVVGCLMDIYSAIVVVVPLIVPLAIHFGVDPVHLGIIFLANLELGFLTPPVGMNLFLAAYRFDKPFIEVMRASLPMVLVLLVGVLLITYWPQLTLWLPALLL